MNDEELRSVLGSVERTRPLTDADRARHASFIAQIAASPVTPTAGASLSLKSVGAAALVLGIAAAVVLSRRPEAPRAAVIPRASAPIARSSVAPSATTAPVATAAPIAPIVAPQTTTPARVVTPSQRRPSAVLTPSARLSLRSVAEPALTQTAAVEPVAHIGGSADALTREAQRLGDAQRLLSRDPTAALAQLEAHRSEFPQGQLGVERELLSVDALLRLGRTQDARTRADALIARNPSGPTAARVRRMLEAR